MQQKGRREFGISACNRWNPCWTRLSVNLWCKKLLTVKGRVWEKKTTNYDLPKKLNGSEAQFRFRLLLLNQAHGDCRDASTRDRSSTLGWIAARDAAAPTKVLASVPPRTPAKAAIKFCCSCGGKCTGNSKFCGILWERILSGQNFATSTCV